MSMDPISAIGIAGSVLSIIDVIGRSLSSLLDLQTRYKRANLTLSLLIGQLSTLKAALNQISEWIAGSLHTVPTHRQLIIDLTTSLDGCKILILIMNDRIGIPERKVNSTLDRLGKVQFLWEEHNLNEYINHLNNQVNALNLLLTALQCRSLFEQRELLQSDTSRDIVKKVEDDMSSLLWLKDTDSYYSRGSIASESSKLYDKVFDFDPEIFNSRVYQGAIRSNMKKKVHDKRIPTEPLEARESVELVPPDQEESEVQTRRQETSWPLPDELQQPLATEEKINKEPEVQTRWQETSWPLPNELHQPLATEEKINKAQKQDKNVGCSDTGIQALSQGKELLSLPPGPSRLSTRRRNRKLPDIDLSAISEASQELIHHSSIVVTTESETSVQVIPEKSRYPPISPTLGLNLRKSPTSPPLMSKTTSGEQTISDADNRARGRFRGMSALLSARNAPTIPQRTQQGKLQKARVSMINNTSQHDRNESRETPKILLLGSCMAGKSTVLKSMKLFAEGSYTHAERESFKDIIFSSIIQGMRAILKAMEGFGLVLDNLENDRHAATISAQPVCMEVVALPPDVGSAIEALWNDLGVQECFKRSEEYQLNDSAHYYFESIQRISMAGYAPTDQDILRSRVKTSGIFCTTFVVGGYTYDVYDVGGTRSERKKWIHCYKDSTAILFVVDISAYDLRLSEDQSVNRIEEDLALFDSICNSRWFTRTPIGLIFTKVDILKCKLPTSPVKKHHDYYGNEIAIGAVKTYFRDKFLALNKNIDRDVQVHYTSIADLDTSVGSAAFDFVKENTNLQNLANNKDTDGGHQATPNKKHSKDVFQTTHEQNWERLDITWPIGNPRFRNGR